jgi:hypothetical protein
MVAREDLRAKSYEENNSADTDSTGPRKKRPVRRRYRSATPLDRFDEVSLNARTCAWGLALSAV